MNLVLASVSAIYIGLIIHSNAICCRDCIFEGPSEGCTDAECAAYICVFDSFCCDVFWDNICLWEAAAGPITDCPDAPDGIVTGQYVIGTNGTWIDGRVHCTDNGMVLATFQGAEGIAAIEEKCEEANDNEWKSGICYLGYHDSNYDDRYIFVDDSDTVDTEAVGHWVPGEPNGGWTNTCGVYVIEDNPDLPFSGLADDVCYPDRDYWSICEILSVEKIEICTNYFYVGDYGAATYEQAQDVCAAYGTTLATVSEDDCDCIQDAFGVNGYNTAWMGLNSLNHETPFFEFDDGTDCPDTDNGRWSGACLGRSCWQNEKPINCNHGGSQCVAIGSDGLINDIACGNTRNGILCNIASGVPAKQIGELSLNIIRDNNGDGNTFTKHADKDIPLVGWLAFVAQVLLVLGLNICGCYYCLCRDNKKKEIADNSLIEYPNKI